MKKILFWSAVTVLAAVSCNKIEDEVPATQSNVPSFVASVDGAETKTVIEGMKSYWNGTEGIRVLDGVLTNGKVYTATVDKTSTATFNEKDANVSLKEGGDYLAVYPEGPAGSVTWDGSIANAAKGFWLPGDQTPTLNSYDPSTHIAVAYAEGGSENLHFKNVNALVKVNLTSDNVTEICFCGNNSDVIAGNFNVAYNSGNPTVDTKNQYNLRYAKVKVESGTLAKGVYYISVLPNTLSKGFSIETVSGGVKSVKKSSGAYEIKRNTIIDLGDIEWVEPEEPSTRKIYFNPGPWNVDGAWFQAWTWGGNTGDAWITFEKTSESGVYSAEIPVDRTGMKVLRKSSSHAADSWTSWNETGDITIKADKDYLTITGWGSNDYKWSSK